MPLLGDVSSRDADAGDARPRASPAVRRFIDALTRAEATGDTAALVALFSDDADLHSLVHHEPRFGREGARRFWAEYLGSFRHVRSRFERITDAAGLVVLEWVTAATLLTGEDVTYRGVSLLEYDHGGDRVRSFRSYYDSAALGARARHGSHDAQG